jgi:PhnB protein
MSKRSPAEQLDQVISALLSASQPLREPPSDRSIATLVSLVRPLRAMSRPEFKASLKSELQRRTTMNEASAPAPAVSETPRFRRPGFDNIAPYFLVKDAPRFLDFLVFAFEATERMRVPRPDGTIMHAEVAVGPRDVIELAEANEQFLARTMTTHLYVPDAHAAYARALEVGATSIHPPNDAHPSGDRWGAVIDPFGNTWFIATPRGWSPGPEGLRTVQPYLHLREAHKMIPFAEAAFGAAASGVAASPEGMIFHATIDVAGATFEIAEARNESEASPHNLHAYVPDTDAAYARALDVGATGVTPPSDAPYGDRTATMKDPFGNTWFLATNLGIGRP